MEFRIGEGEPLKFCLVNTLHHLVLYGSETWLLRDEVDIKVAKISLRSLKEGKREGRRGGGRGRKEGKERGVIYELSKPRLESSR